MYVSHAIENPIKQEGHEQIKFKIHTMRIDGKEKAPYTQTIIKHSETEREKEKEGDEKRIVAEVVHCVGGVFWKKKELQQGMERVREKKKKRGDERRKKAREKAGEQEGKRPPPNLLGAQPLETFQVVLRRAEMHCCRAIECGLHRPGRPRWSIWASGFASACNRARGEATTAAVAVKKTLAAANAIV